MIWVGGRYQYPPLHFHPNKQHLNKLNSSPVFMFLYGGGLCGSGHHFFTSLQNMDLQNSLSAEIWSKLYHKASRCLLGVLLYQYSNKALNTWIVAVICNTGFPIQGSLLFISSPWSLSGNMNLDQVSNSLAGRDSFPSTSVLGCSPRVRRSQAWVPPLSELICGLLNHRSVWVSFVFLKKLVYFERSN